jgi:SHS2 domain-containing protein
MSIEELEHTADLRFLITAPTLDALFSEAVRALMTTMYGDIDGPGDSRRSIEVAADDREALLHDFLSEVLYLSEVENLVFSEATLSVTETPPSVRGTLAGTAFDPARHAGGTEVKGIPYYDLTITGADDRFRLQLLFDV